jgi:hypothetical protein
MTHTYDACAECEREHDHMACATCLPARLMLVRTGNLPDPMAAMRPAPLTRRERRIERMRTQRIGHVARTTYRTSGTPHMSRPGIARPDATIYIVRKAVPE